MRRFLFGLFVIAGVLGAPAAAGAQSVSSQITLSGVVPEMRFVYVNQEGFIVKIVGNTSDNITPRAAGANNKEVPMTGALWQQYSYFMDQHGWKLDAGVSYDVNPVQINNEASAQNIEINSQLQSRVDNLQLQAGLTPGFGQNG